MRLLAFAAVAALAGCTTPVPEFKDFTCLGCPIPGDYIESPKLVFAPDGGIQVFYDFYDVDTAGASIVQPATWMGSAWNADPSIPGALDGRPVYGTDGVLRVAVADHSHSDRFWPVQTLSWTGTAWAPGAKYDPGDGGRLLNHLSVTFAPDGTAYAIVEPSGDGIAVLSAALDGGSFTQVGGVVAPSGTVGIAFMPSGAPVLAWLESSWPGRRFRFNSWTGATWEPAFGALDIAGVSGEIDWSIGPDGSPWVAWSVTNDNSGIHVEHWTGSAWESVGTPLSGPATPVYYTVSPMIRVSPDGVPILAFVHSALLLYRWSGTAWEPLGPPKGFLAQSDAYAPDVQLDAEGHAAVAWVEHVDGPLQSSRALFVARYSGP